MQQDKLINIRINKETSDKFTALCKREQISVTQKIRNFILSEIKKQTKLTKGETE